MSPTYLSPACVLCTVDHNGRYFSLWGYNDEQIIWHLYHQPTGTPIVTKTGDAYLKLSVKPGPTQASAEWALYMKNGMRVPPNPNTNVRFPVPNVGGLGHNVGMQRWIAAKDIELKPLKQYDYVAPRASYDARLVWEDREPLSALVRDRIRDTVDGSAAPIPSDVGEKVIICFGPCEVQPSIGGLVWRSKQVRPRKLGLLFCVADAIRKFMVRLRRCRGTLPELTSCHRLWHLNRTLTRCTTMVCRSPKTRYT
ncbi:hypothetical protein C2E23DRAFT_214426 [Lenzites betulinus]|nr:hypothetical protein C2E23DRAFT_214426 [Lenzites betulinus]